MSIVKSAVLSRIIAIILGIIAMFNGAEMSNITFELKGAVTTQSESIVVEVFNYTGQDIEMDEYFTLEVKQNDEWVKVAQSGSVNDITRVIKNIRSAEITINIVKAFGKTLDVGEYRLTKNYTGANTCSVIFNVIEV